MTGQPLVNVRLGPSVTAAIDAIARSEGVTRSDVIRRALAETIARHSPSLPDALRKAVGR